MRLETICGYVILDNLRMIHLCTKKGFQMEPQEEGTAKMLLKLA